MILNIGATYSLEWRTRCRALPLLKAGVHNLTMTLARSIGRNGIPRQRADARMRPGHEDMAAHEGEPS